MYTRFLFSLSFSKFMLLLFVSFWCFLFVWPCVLCVCVCTCEMMYCFWSVPFRHCVGVGSFCLFYDFFPPSFVDNELQLTTYPERSRWGTSSGNNNNNNKHKRFPILGISAAFFHFPPCVSPRVCVCVCLRMPRVLCFWLFLVFSSRERTGQDGFIVCVFFSVLRRCVCAQNNKTRFPKKKKKRRTKTTTIREVMLVFWANHPPRLWLGAAQMVCVVVVVVVEVVVVVIVVHLLGGLCVCVRVSAYAPCFVFGFGWFCVSRSTFHTKKDGGIFLFCLGFCFNFYYKLFCHVV